MQIQSLSLSDFGGWKNLSLGNLSGSLNVLHGPNEVGKTTLLRFLREMLYGQKLAREDELLAFPLSQGRCVGICDVETPTGRFRLERSFCLSITRPRIGLCNGFHEMHILYFDIFIKE